MAFGYKEDNRFTVFDELTYYNLTGYNLRPRTPLIPDPNKVLPSDLIFKDYDHEPIIGPTRESKLREISEGFENRAKINIIKKE
jgi:hypothetical protein